MKKLVIAVALLLVASLAGWYFASPGFAMMQLRDAAKSGDAEALEQRIDFPAVREELKEDFRASLADKMASNEDGADKLGAAFAMALADPMIDTLVTPKSIATLVEQGEVQLNGGDAASGERGQPPEWVIERDGLSRFTARPQDRETLSVASDAPGLVFERDGLGWRLVELQIPQ